MTTKERNTMGEFGNGGGDNGVGKVALVKGVFAFLAEILFRTCLCFHSKIILINEKT